jgi:hypothetical protein
LEADLDPSFKAILLAKLEEIRSALLAYRVFGLAPLRTAVESAIGSLIVEQEQARKPSNQRTVSQFLTLVSQIQTVVRGAITLARELPEVVLGLLGSGT